jgi:hypothetical protein
VFANRRIPSGSIIGEYLGKLYPLGNLQARDKYAFLISEIAEVTASKFGNFTRFVNHHCGPNLTPRLGMYGKRQVVLYQANREIEAGEQLFIDYGTWYFSLPNNPCKCDAQDGDHLPDKFKSQASTKSKVATDKARTSRTAAQSRSRKLPKSSKITQRYASLGKAANPSISTRDRRGSACEKQSRKQSDASLKSLTRSAGVGKR